MGLIGAQYICSTGMGTKEMRNCIEEIIEICAVCVVSCRFQMISSLNSNNRKKKKKMDIQIITHQLKLSSCIFYCWLRLLYVIRFESIANLIPNAIMKQLNNIYIYDLLLALMTLISFIFIEMLMDETLLPWIRTHLCIFKKTVGTPNKDRIVIFVQFCRMFGLWLENGPSIGIVFKWSKEIGNEDLYRLNPTLLDYYYDSFFYLLLASSLTRSTKEKRKKSSWTKCMIIIWMGNITMVRNVNEGTRSRYLKCLT